MTTTRRLPTRYGDPYAAVCTVLWSERELLEALACSVVVRRLVGRTDDLAASHVDAEQAELLDRLSLQEVLRAAVVEAVDSVTGPGGPRSLYELAATAPEPWSTMLFEHREALRALATELSELTQLRQLSLAEFLG